METREELDRLQQQFNADPSPANRSARRRFWRIVGDLKRQPRPDPEIVEKVSNIRDLLYLNRLGGVLRLRWLTVWLGCGLAMAGYYFSLVLDAGRVTGELARDWDLGLAALGAVFFLYPFGRLCAGQLFGIRLDGITRDIYWLPTLKINYRSYLLAAPPQRMWFFFWSGAWTSIVLLVQGACGYLLAGEWSALLYGVVLALAEALAAVIGTRWGGELGHFRRERFIVRDWRQAMQ